MSSEKFEALKDDLNTILDRLKKTIHERIPGLYGEEKKNAKREAERSLEEATILIQEMEQESKAAPQSYRMQMMNQLKNYRKEIENLRRSFKMVSDGSGLESAGFDRESKMESTNRQKLFSGMQSLHNASESIARSQQVASETDAIGAEIIQDLGRQRDTLERTKDRLSETDANLSKSRRIMKTMIRRVMTDKMILIAIILVELAALGGVIYWKFF